MCGYEGAAGHLGQGRLIQQRFGRRDSVKFTKGGIIAELVGVSAFSGVGTGVSLNVPGDSWMEVMCLLG